jgi:ATP-grasp domain-containing protein
MTCSGSLVVFGLGGVDTDLLADHGARLAPLADTDADLLMDAPRSSTALWSQNIDRAAVRDLLLRVSRLAELVPEIAELDLNPVRVTATVCVALDVRVRLEPREPTDPFLCRLRPLTGRGVDRGDRARRNLTGTGPTPAPCVVEGSARAEGVPG